MNTKFLVLVVAFAAVAIGAVGLFWAYNLMKDPTRNIAQGRELEKAGDYDGAMKAYGRAVAKRGSNIEYIDLMRAALLKIMPPTVQEARDHYNMNLALLRRRAEIDPSNPEPWRLLLEAFEDRAQFVQSPAGWQAVADTASEMLKAVPSGGEAELLALRELGYAVSRRDAQATDAERKSAEAGLRKVVAANPKDDRAWDALLLILINDAHRQFLANQQVPAQERRKQFEEALAEAEAAIPGSPAVALGRARLIRVKFARGEITGAEALAQLDPSLADLERAASNPEASPAVVISSFEQLLSSGRPEDSLRAAAVIESWAKGHPNDLVMRRLQSIALQSADPDQSLLIAQRIIDSPPLPVSMQAAFRDEIRGDAAGRIFDIEVDRAANADTDAARKEHLAKAEKMRALLVEFARGRPDDVRLLKAEAKLALLDKDPVTASAKLDRVLATAGGVPDEEVFMLAADAAIRRSEPGAALNYINRGIEQAGATYGLLLARARIELSMRRGADALRTAEQVLSIRADDPVALQVRDAANNLLTALSPEGTKDPLVLELQESERLLSDRKTDQAAAIVEKLLKAHPADARVLTQAARIDLVAGNAERAVERLDAALAIAPNDPFIAQLRAIAGTSDPVERIDKIVELTVADEKLRATARYALIMSVISSVRKDIDSGARTDDGRVRRPGELEAVLAKLEAEVPAAREAASTTGTNPAVIFGTRFDEAVLAGDYRLAEQVGAEAEKEGNPAFGVFLRSRAMVLQGRSGEALDLIEKTREKGIKSAELSRQAAQAREALGQVTEALAEYKDAYERRPSDFTTVRAYAELLQRTGDTPRALQLFRDAAQTNAGDRNVLNAWLRMEELVGERALALCWRRKIYREVPSDRDNALALAVMLTEGQANPRLLMDEQCRPRYTDTAWSALPAARRQQEIQAMLAENHTEGSDIFRKLLLSRSDDFETALLQARAMRRSGRTEDGEKLLRTVIEKAEPSQVGPMWIGLGQYLEDLGRTADAVQAFAEAQKLQDPVRREADFSISNIWFDRQQWERALDPLKAVVDAQPEVNPGLLRRLTEIATKLRRFDEADAYLARSRTGPTTAPLDAINEMLAANIAQGRAEDAWSRQDKEAMLKETAKAEAALRRAAELHPGNALPWLALAGLQQDLYIRTRDAKVLNDALANVDRGISMASTYWPAVRLREQILLEKGDLLGATQAVERYLPVAANNSEARQHLADLHLRAGNAQRALTVLNDGAALNPNDPLWQMAIGELQLRRGQSADAIAAFDRGLELAPSASSLARAIEARVRASPPDWSGIVALAKQYPAEVRGSGAMRSALGAALVYTGERETGLQSIRDTGRFIRDEIAAKRMRNSELDSWYTTVRYVFPVPRTADLDAFVRDALGGNLGPDDQRWLASLWTEVGPDGVSRAKEYLDLARAQMDTQDELFRSRVWLTAGNLAYLSNDCAGAISSFEKVVKEDPGNTAAMNNLGYLLSKCQGEHAKAIEYGRRAVSAAPSQPEFLDTLGYALVRNGEFGEARTVLDRAIRLMPTAGSYLNFAEALHGLGEDNEARQALDKAIGLNPSPETRQEIETLRSKLK